jgi:hypothetical protein
VQRNAVADEVQALIAVVIPVLKGTLFAIKQEAINDAGGAEHILLRQLPRTYRTGDGDCGISFEYAVHDAIRTGNADVVGRVQDALHRHCRIRQGNPSSLLFGVEKTGALQLIDSVKENLTNESRLLSGSKGQPVKLKKHIDSVAAAFRRRAARETLPSCISGLWKADLFLGTTEVDQWVGTTVKINPRHLEGAPGLRVAVVPSQQGRNDQIRRDNQKNLVVVPLPYDGAFMEVFYQGWQIVQQFIAADAQLPKEVALPRAADRQVCRMLVERRDFPVVDVLDALAPLAQPELLETREEAATVDYRRGDSSETNILVAPLASANR